MCSGISTPRLAARVAATSPYWGEVSDDAATSLTSAAATGPGSDTSSANSTRPPDKLPRPPRGAEAPPRETEAPTRLPPRPALLVSVDTVGEVDAVDAVGINGALTDSSTSSSSSLPSTIDSTGGVVGSGARTSAGFGNGTAAIDAVCGPACACCCAINACICTKIEATSCFSAENSVADTAGGTVAAASGSTCGC